MRVIWSPTALSDLAEIQTYIGAENPSAADRVERAIVAATRKLADYPLIGQLRSGHYREIVERRYRYVIRYELTAGILTDSDVVILSIWHPKQAR